ncbi:PIG-L family deacetylase [Candidatus Wolfebacteria bacterium]|nr:PIG-L family deacetylase [Candidatus Wolfebacteria bacterium]
MDFTKSLLAIFAHPDDETFGAGGLLAHINRAGGRTAVISATRGEKGKLHLDIPMAPEELAKLREEELMAAAKILGVSRVHALTYPDGGLDEQSENEVVKKLLEIIKEFSPYAILTFGPDGGTGHRDHIAIHKFACRAFQEAQQFGEPPRELYFRATPKAVRELRREAAVVSGRKKTAGHYEESKIPLPYSEEDFIAIDVLPVVHLKNQAAQMHKSQNPKWFLEMPEELKKAFWEKEYYYLAAITKTP